MLYQGDRKLRLLLGDSKPFALYKGNRKIAGAKREIVSGKGVVGWDAPYKAEMPQVIVEGLGKQDRLKGKNLIPYPYYDKNKTGSLNITVNQDGTVLLDGINDTPNTIYFVLFKSEKLLVTNEEMFLSGCPSGGNGGTFELQIWKPGSFYNDFGKGVYVPKGTEYLQIYIAVRTGAKCNKLLFKPQLEKGSTATPYEPYCGGIPAPNPDYPIEPEFLEGKVEAKGKNLFNPKDLKGWEPFSAYIIYKLPKLSNTVLSIERKNPEVDLTDISFGIVSPFTQYPTGGNFEWMLDNGNITVPSFNNTKDWEWLFVYPRKDGVIERLMEGLNIQFEFASSPSSYEPYFNGGVAELPTLRAVGDIKDEIDLTTGVITRRVGVRKFNGKESWRVHPNAGAQPIYSLMETTKGIYNQNGLSSHFLPGNWDNGLTKNRYVVFPNQFIIKTNGEQSLDNFKAFLVNEDTKGTPITIYYPLKNPVEEKVNPAILTQHPGYTQLIATNPEAAITATAYKEEI